MGQRTVHEDLPEQSDIEEAIVRYVKDVGRCKFGELVKPMADRFRLTDRQRDKKAGLENVWYHCCNSACQSLVADGVLERINGYYRLTDFGVKRISKN